MPRRKDGMCSRCGLENKRDTHALCNSCHNAYIRVYRKTYQMTPEQRIKDTARHIANVYQSRGKLIPQPCEVCGTIKKVEKHHEDYSKPLEVRWLCRSCHHAEHYAVELDGTHIPPLSTVLRSP